MPRTANCYMHRHVLQGAAAMRLWQLPPQGAVMEARPDLRQLLLRSAHAGERVRAVGLPLRGSRSRSSLQCTTQALETPEACSA